MANEPINENNTNEEKVVKKKSDDRQRTQSSRSTSSGGSRHGGGRSQYQSNRSSGGMRRGRYQPRRKVCNFCVDKVKSIDWKDYDSLRRYINNNGSIRARRKTGTCAKHQRQLAVAIKRARHMALTPFTDAHARFMSKG